MLRNVAAIFYLRQIFLFSTIIGGALISCSGHHPKDKMVGREYLDSPDFRQFEHDYEKEQAYRTDEDSVLVRMVRFIRKKYRDRQISLPFQLNSKSLDTYIRPANRVSVDASAITSPGKSGMAGYTLYPVGLLKRQEWEALFFLVKEPSVYRNVHLGIAVFTGGVRPKIKAIAAFKKTLNVEETSKVEIAPSGIISVSVRREAKYPVSQQTDHHFKLKIDVRGNILPAQ